MSNPSRLTISGPSPTDRRLALDGDIDAHTAPELESALDALGSHDDVTVELGRVGFIDSSGLRVLITAHTALAERGVRLVLQTPSPAVERLFEITGLTGHLHIV